MLGKKPPKSLGATFVEGVSTDEVRKKDPLGRISEENLFLIRRIGPTDP